MWLCRQNAVANQERRQHFVVYKPFLSSATFCRRGTGLIEYGGRIYVIIKKNIEEKIEEKIEIL